MKLIKRRHLEHSEVHEEETPEQKEHEETVERQGTLYEGEVHLEAAEEHKEAKPPPDEHEPA